MSSSSSKNSPSGSYIAITYKNVLASQQSVESDCERYSHDTFLPYLKKCAEIPKKRFTLLPLFLECIQTRYWKLTVIFVCGMVDSCNTFVLHALLTTVTTKLPCDYKDIKMVKNHTCNEMYQF